MPIEWEHPGTPPPPLKKETPPVVSVEALAAVAEVRLMAGDVPPRMLRQFYEQILGLKFVEADADTMTLAYQRRRIVLARGAAEPGLAAFLVRDFSDMMVRLRDQGIPYEVLHGDAGMTRMALLHDPAGNWVQLVETRAF